jgi:chromosome segregation ATPase
MLTRRVVTIAIALTLLAAPAFGGSSKEMIELQTQVQQLLKMQQAIDEKMGVLQESMKTLTQQTNDALARVTASADKVDRAIARENAASDSCVDQLTGQAQPLHDALTELKASVAAMNRQLNELSGAKQVMPQQQGALPSTQPQGNSANPHQ